MNHVTLTEFPEIRRAILSYIKQNRYSNITDLAEAFRLSYEAIRQQMIQLEKDGLVAVRLNRRSNNKGGRPLKEYYLTNAGDHLFDKHYDQLAMELIETTTETLGVDALRQILTVLTEKRVKVWAPRLEGLSAEDRLSALRDIYLEGDPFMKMKKEGDKIYLIEQNCPFLNVANRHPMLCSVTVSTLSRLLGFRIKREKKFQNGDGCCVFRVMKDRPITDEDFCFEEELQ